MLKITRDLVHTVHPYRYSSLRRLLQPRHFQAYCLGTNKSGTHSIANMLAKNYQSDHENDHGTLINGYIDWQEGKIDPVDFQEILLNHDKYAWLEMDSSHVHIEYVDLLVELFPKAKFILTIRDCYSWLDSYLNHSLNYKLYDSWDRLHNWRYGRGEHTYSITEAVLQEGGFYPLRNYFTAWSTHNQRALDAIPPERLLILRTSEISHSSEKIGKFLNTPNLSLDIQRTHSFQAPKKHHILTKIDENYLREQGEKYCGELMKEFFDDRDYLSLILSKSPVKE
jgi:hypothetical protein